MFDTKKLALFLGGVVFGSAGFKVLSSKDAKKVYTQTTAAVLRMKDCTMQTVNKVQEEAGDILADAKAINESRAAEAAQEVIEDTAGAARRADCTVIQRSGAALGRLFFTQRGKKSNEMYDLA